MNKKDIALLGSEWDLSGSKIGPISTNSMVFHKKSKAYIKEAPKKSKENLKYVVGIVVDNGNVIISMESKYQYGDIKIAQKVAERFIEAAEESFLCVLHELNRR